MKTKYKRLAKALKKLPKPMATLIVNELILKTIGDIVPKQGLRS